MVSVFRMHKANENIERRTTKKTKRKKTSVGYRNALQTPQKNTELNKRKIRKKYWPKKTVTVD